MLKRNTLKAQCWISTFGKESTDKTQTTPQNREKNLKSLKMKRSFGDRKTKSTNENPTVPHLRNQQTLGSGPTVTDRVGKSGSIERRTNTLLVSAFSWDLLAIEKYRITPDCEVHVWKELIVSLFSAIFIEFNHKSECDKSSGQTLCVAYQNKKTITLIT